MVQEPSGVGSSKKSSSKFSKLKNLRLKNLKNLSKNTILSGSLIAVLVIVGAWAFLFSNNTKKELAQSEKEEVSNIETAPAMGAIISYKEGNVEFKDEKGAWVTANTDTSLISGTGLRTTGASSRAIVLLDDGSAVRLDANTEVTFESLTMSRVVIAQESGHLYNRVTPSDSRDFIVGTKEAQFQSVGTAFRTIANGDEEAVEVYQSTVKETSTNLSAVEGEKLIIKNYVYPDKDETKEKIDIENLKKDTFITWNKEQDLKDPNFKSSLGFLGDFDGPKIDITEPAVGSTIETESDSQSGSTSIKGKTEGKSKLTVQSKSQSGSTPVEVVVNDDGSFDTGLLIAPIGNSVFEFIAIDKVGNKTTLSVKYVFKRKAVVQTQGITLSIDTTSDEDNLLLSWSLSGITTPDGVKVLYGKNSDPSYPDDYRGDYIQTGTTTSIEKSSISEGKPYYFKVCRYTSSECDVYSNEVKVEL